MKLWHGNRGHPRRGQQWGSKNVARAGDRPFGSSQPGFIAPGCESQWAGRSMRVIGGLPHGPSGSPNAATGGPSAGRNAGTPKLDAAPGTSQWLRPINKFSSAVGLLWLMATFVPSFDTTPRRRRRFMAWPCLRGGKRGQAPFAGTALRVLRTKGACPLFPVSRTGVGAETTRQEDPSSCRAWYCRESSAVGDARAQRAISSPRPWVIRVLPIATV